MNDEKSMKSRGVAFLFWLGCLFGFCGLHRLYLGRILSGLFLLVTFGLCGIWQFIDLILLLCNVLRDGDGKELSC